MQRKGELEELEKNLKEQQEKMLVENQMHQATADHCKLLKDENDRSDPHEAFCQFKNVFESYSSCILRIAPPPHTLCSIPQTEHVLSSAVEG